jgi:hypothetical protein
MCNQGMRIIGLTRVLRPLARRPTLTKLDLHCVTLGRKEARLLGTVLCNTPSLHTLVFIRSMLENGGLLEELAPALYHNTSIKEVDMSDNNLNYIMESARLLRDILRSNKKDHDHTHFVWEYVWARDRRRCKSRRWAYCRWAGFWAQDRRRCKSRR